MRCSHRPPQRPFDMENEGHMTEHIYTPKRTIPSPAVLEKLAMVRKDIGGVRATGYNAFSKYNYVEAKEVISSVRSSMVEHGLVLFVIDERVVSEISDGKMRYVTLEITYCVADTETGEGYRATVCGSGSDKGDKAIWKAKTGAMKYFLFQTFQIPQGVDPESDSEVDREASKPSRAEAYESMLAFLRKDFNGAVRWAGNKFGAVRIAELAANHDTPGLAEAIVALEYGKA